MNHWEKVINEINNSLSHESARTVLISPAPYKGPQEIIADIAVQKNFIGPRSWYQLFQKKTSSKV